MGWLVALCVFIVLIVIFTCFIRYLRHDQTLSVKSLFWIYFRTFALIGLLILIIGGLTPVVQAVFSLVFGPEFSYSSHEEYYSGVRRIVVDGSPSASLVIASHYLLLDYLYGVDISLVHENSQQSPLK